MPNQGEIVEFPEMKVSSENLEVIFGTGILLEKDCSPKDEAVKEGLTEVNRSIAQNNEHLHVLNDQIEQLTNHADGLDYMVAAGSGILAGFIDVFWVGKFELEHGKAEGQLFLNRKGNSKVSQQIYHKQTKPFSQKRASTSLEAPWQSQLPGFW